MVYYFIYIEVLGQTKLMYAVRSQGGGHSVWVGVWRATVLFLAVDADFMDMLIAVKIRAAVLTIGKLFSLNIMFQ